MYARHRLVLPLALLATALLKPLAGSAASGEPFPDSSSFSLDSPRFLQESLLRRPSLYDYRVAHKDPYREGRQWAFLLCILGLALGAAGIGAFVASHNGGVAASTKRAAGIAGFTGVAMLGVGLLLARSYNRRTE